MSYSEDYGITDGRATLSLDIAFHIQKKVCPTRVLKAGSMSFWLTKNVNRSSHRALPKQDAIQSVGILLSFVFLLIQCLSPSSSYDII